MYGDTCTPQWHFGKGPDQPPTSCHMSGDVLRQGETVANVLFKIVTAGCYMTLMKVLDGRGCALLTLSNESKITAPPEFLVEIVGVLIAQAMSEAGLATQARKNIVYVQPSAHEVWTIYLDNNLRNSDISVLSLHDIPDGRLPQPVEVEDAFYEPPHGPMWHESDGVNILGTSLGSPTFVEEYL